MNLYKPLEAFQVKKRKKTSRLLSFGMHPGTIQTDNSTIKQARDCDISRLSIALIPSYRFWTASRGVTFWGSSNRKRIFGLLFVEATFYHNRSHIFRTLKVYILKTRWKVYWKRFKLRTLFTKEITFISLGKSYFKDRIH